MADANNFWASVKPSSVPPVRKASRNTLFVGLLTLVIGIAGCETGTPSAPSSSISVPLVYFQRAPVGGWQAVDWKGALHGTIGSDHVGIPYQSPDGTRLAWSTEGVWQVVDRNGKLLSRPDLSRSRGFTWADDASGLCVLNVLKDNPPNGGSYQLDFDQATGGFKTVASLTTTKGPNIAACSPSADRVVITTASSSKSLGVMQITFGELDVIDLKTGVVRFQQTFPLGNASSEVRGVTVSHDGGYAALATSTRVTIVSLVTGAVVSQLTGPTPLAFSWDGRQLAIDNAANRGEVLTVSNGKVVWSDSTLNRVTQGAVPDPAGSSLMLLTTTGGLDDLLVVSPSGIEQTIAKDVFPAQIAPCSNCSAF